MVPIIEYNTKSGKKRIDQILQRSQLDHGSVQGDVTEIINNVRVQGDKAVFAYTEEFDRVVLDKKSVRVSGREIKEAYDLIETNLVGVIKKSAARIAEYHEKQKRNSWLEPSPNGETLGQMIRPIERVGVYVPGGKAAYPSSVLMNVVPAVVAGVKNIIMATPPGIDGKVSPAILVAAHVLGIKNIYKIGGAQAVAAMAFGTESVPKVDKIVGPGNIYVALAKRSVYGHVNIDSIAGPSEILIIADEEAKAKYVAADLLSQAEHDELASSVLITTSKKLAEKVQKELETQTQKLERRVIIEKSLNDYGAIVLVDDLEQAVTLSNAIAPEHLEICIREPFSLLGSIENAGAVFLGNYTPEPLGDYMAGPNHVLPTGGTSRFFSPLSVDDFIKKTSVLSFNKEAFKSLADDVIAFARAEGLTAHANSIRVRLNEKNK